MGIHFRNAKKKAFRHNPTDFRELVEIEFTESGQLEVHINNLDITVVGDDESDLLSRISGWVNLTGSGIVIDVLEVLPSGILSIIGEKEEENEEFETIY